MTVAVPRPSRVPALVLLAALAAPAALAGDVPVTPFPGTSVPGTSVSGTSIPGAAVERGRTDDRDAAAEASPPAAPEAGAEAPGMGGRAADAGFAEAGSPGGSEVAEKPSVPARGSRLLRALAELPKTLVPEPGGAPNEAALHGTAPVFVAEGCPRALLRRLLAGCRERQEILAGLFETEARLRGLREAGRGREPEPQIPAPSAAPAPAADTRAGDTRAGETPALATAAPSPLRAALGGAAEKRNEADTGAADAGAEDPRAAEPRAPRYAWFSIIGTAGALRAGVTDGTGVWFVREGDALPGGATVAAIAGRPPAVRVRGAGESGEAAPLPFRARQGDAR